MQLTADGVEIIPGPDGTPLFYRSAIFPGMIKGGAWWDGHCICANICMDSGMEKYNCVVKVPGKMPDLLPEECYSTREAGEQAIEAESKLLT